MKSKPKLDPARLYIGDNGRIFCGALQCAGMSAHFTGRTIAGQRVRPITDAYAVSWPTAELGPVKCESCGRGHATR